MKVVGLKDRTQFHIQFINPRLKAGLLAMTIPDKPRSRLQRFRTTEAGLAVLGQVGNGKEERGM
jgi:ATP-dependent DNA helicase RecG